jgi:hypothetical protein
MAFIINNYQDAVNFIKANPNKSLVATADGSLRQKTIVDSLRSFGAFFAGKYRGNLETRNAAVADALVRLHANSGITSESLPHSIAGFQRYFQAKVDLQDRQIAADAKAANKVSKGALNALSGAKRVSPKDLGKHIFDLKPKKYQVDLGKQKTSEILGALSSLATESNTVGRVINQESGLAEQFITDVERQENFFTDVTGKTVQTRSKSDAITALKDLAGNPAAAKALSCLTNQASILTLLTDVTKSLDENKLIVPLINNDHATMEHHLINLENGNIQYQFNFFAPINGISSDHGDFLSTERWQKPYRANPSEFDLQLSASIELDAIALGEGRLEVIKHKPFTFNINLRPDTA